MPTSYRLKKDRLGHTAGTLVYMAKSYDYGLARDDTMYTGVPHVSVTLNPDGSAPTFTVPEFDLEDVPSSSPRKWF